MKLTPTQVKRLASYLAHVEKGQGVTIEDLREVGRSEAKILHVVTDNGQQEWTIGPQGGTPRWPS